MTRTGYTVLLAVGASSLFAAQAANSEEAPRLKFRDRGPTCMCVGGLSEEDIRRKERQRTATGERLQGLTEQQLDDTRVRIDSKRRGDE